MKLALIHAVLLLASLGFAFQTWTREEGVAAPAGSVVLWEENEDDIVSITYESDVVRTVIERREDEAGTYLWGTIERLGAAADPPPAELADSFGITLPDSPRTLSFVVGEQTEQLLGNAATPQALRDLGVPSEESELEYGLAGAVAKLTVVADRTRELDVGGTPWGSSDRYVRDPATGRAYAMRAELVRTMEDAEFTLPERRLHTFELGEVGSVSVRTDRGERTMRRGESTVPPLVWTDTGTPDQPSQTFTNFMDRLGELWLIDFNADLDPQGLTHIVRLDYFDEDGRAIGFLDLYRGPLDGELPSYYVRTEQSRVLSGVYPPIADQVEQDVAQLF